MLSLIRMSDEWHVYLDEDSTYDFATIELAAEFLNSSCKINDDEIDEAIIQIHLSGKSKAIFTYDGKFKETVDMHTS